MGYCERTHTIHIDTQTQYNRFAICNNLKTLEKFLVRQLVRIALYGLVSHTHNETEENVMFQRAKYTYN